MRPTFVFVHGRCRHRAGGRAGRRRGAPGRRARAGDPGRAQPGRADPHRGRERDAGAGRAAGLRRRLVLRGPAGERIPGLPGEPGQPAVLGGRPGRRGARRAGRVPGQLANLQFHQSDEAARVDEEATRARAETWGRIPRSYLRLTRDRALPVGMQDRMISEADALTPDNPFDVHSLASSHIGFQVHPGEAVDILDGLGRRG